MQISFYTLSKNLTDRIYRLLAPWALPQLDILNNKSQF